MDYFRKMMFMRLFYSMIPSAKRRSRILKKHNYFYEMGENVHFQPRKLPADPKFIKIHNNVSVASDVSFITHDIIQNVINGLDDAKDHPKCESHLGCIEIMDNVFIGSGTKIMPNVKIGPNVIVAAGSVITKDVPSGVVVGGVPARVIGSFDDVVAKRREESKSIKTHDRLARVESEWEKFYAQREK